MPSIFTPAPAKTKLKEPGLGGKPPADRRPTGGGGGGGDDDWKSPSRGPRVLLYRMRAIAFGILTGYMVFFVVLVSSFYVRLAGAHVDLLRFGGEHLALPPILFLNTAVLVLSSLAMETARRHIFREMDVLEEWFGLGHPALSRTLPWVAATLMLGVLFLAGQVIAWRQWTAQGFVLRRWTTSAGYFFYTVVSLHAVHLLLGILALLLCLCALGFFKRVDYRQIAIDATAWFWHTMAMTWVLLFAVLTLAK